MHLVFVTSLVPDGAPSTGYEIANSAIIAALRRQSVRVTVVGFVRPGGKPSDPDNTIVLGSLDPATDNAPFAQKIRWIARALLDRLTVSSAKLRILSEEMFEQALQSAGEFDGYVLNAVQMTGAYEACLQNKPALFVAHNVEHVSARQNADVAGGFLQRILFKREARLLEIIENRLCERSQFVFTLAEADRHLLGVDSPDKSAALPLVTREKPATSSKQRMVNYDAGLIGTWTWQPNRIGLEWFLTKVAPHLDPRFEIVVAGNVPCDLLENHQNVRFAGRVENADDFVKSAGVIPLISRAGTGVQLKTIETFELGLPAVATTSSLRGISTVPDNCIVTDDPREFAEAMTQLAHNRNTVDGADFFHAQMWGLDENLAKGLKTLGHTREKVPA